MLPKKVNALTINEAKEIVGGKGYGWIGWVYDAIAEWPDFKKGYKEGYKKGHNKGKY